MIGKRGISMRDGKDDMDTHESMQINRHQRKYEEGAPIRHPGKNRLRHRGEEPNDIPGEPDVKTNK